VGSEVVSAPCDCDGGRSDGSDCEGECCGIGQCVCTPVIAEAWAAARGIRTPTTDEIVDGILHNDNDGARFLRQLFGLPGDPL
jgi:hypothetical protein